MNLKARLLLMERDHPALFKILNLRYFFNFIRNVSILLRFGRVVILSPIAFFVSRFQSSYPPVVMIATRDSHIGPCSLQLIYMVSSGGDRELVLSVKNRDKFNSICTDLLTEAGIKIDKIVEQDSFTALCQVHRAKVHIAFEGIFETFVAATSPKVLVGRGTQPVVVPDGVVTKTNGNLIPSQSIANAGLRSWLNGRAARRITYVSQSGVDNYRTCVNTGVRSPSLMRPVGLPRFLRAEKLRDGKIKPVLTANFRSALDADKANKKIVLALTKNKESSDLDFFLKQMGINISELEAILDAADTSLWIKSHQSTFSLGDNTAKINENQQRRIFTVGLEDGLSSVDLFGSFNGLLTDISSIYVDFLPFDKPIGFVRYDNWKGQERFCYPTSPFYPGAKLNNMNDLNAFFLDPHKDERQLALEREYGRRVLLGDNTDEAFWTNLL